MLITHSDAKISRSGDFYADNQQTDKTNHFTPCPCLQGNNIFIAFSHQRPDKSVEVAGMCWLVMVSHKDTITIQCCQAKGGKLVSNIKDSYQNIVWNFPHRN